MTWRIEWLQSALDELTNIWLRADLVQRRAVTTASQRIDSRLRTDAPTEGESRSEGRRIMFAEPLTVVYRIESDGKTVSVLQVRMYQRRG